CTAAPRKERTGADPRASMKPRFRCRTSASPKPRKAISRWSKATFWSCRRASRTRTPVEIAQSYPVRQGVAPNKQWIWLKPSTVLDKVEEGGSGGKHFELVENADIMIETTYRSDAQRIYHRGFGQDEIAFQLSGRRATRTNQGEYMLETGDFLLIPPGTSHRNVGDMATIRIILYTRKPVRLADEFIERARRAGQPIA